ncbi:MAG: hypothetical protein U1G07_18095 [Verrucomicrobiota bacterium]
MKELGHLIRGKRPYGLVWNLLLLAFPLAVAGYGLWCVFTQHSYHVGKMAFGWTNGPLAVKDGWAYFTAGVYAAIRGAISDRPHLSCYGLLLDWICLIILAWIVFA